MNWHRKGQLLRMATGHRPTPVDENQPIVHVNGVMQVQGRDYDVFAGDIRFKTPPDSTDNVDVSYASPQGLIHQGNDMYDVLLLPREMAGMTMDDAFLLEMKQDSIGREFSGDSLRRYNMPSIITGVRYICTEAYLNDAGLRGRVMLVER